MATKVPSTRSAKLRHTAVRTWKIPGFDEEFIQDPLTFFEKNEFLALVATGLENAVASGMDLEAVLTVIGMDRKKFADMTTGKLTWETAAAASGILNLITRVISGAPRLLEDTYLLALSVDPADWEKVRLGLRQIDDETGFGILETFVEQNATTIRDFFASVEEAARHDASEADADTDDGLIRRVTALERLEEYSARHAETYNELGNWPADRFEAAWDAYVLRHTLEMIDVDQKNMINALYANGMIGGDAIEKEIRSIQSNYRQIRAKLLGSDLPEEESLSYEAPYPKGEEAAADAA